MLPRQTSKTCTTEGMRNPSTKNTFRFQGPPRRRSRNAHTSVLELSVAPNLFFWWREQAQRKNLFLYTVRRKFGSTRATAMWRLSPISKVSDLPGPSFDWSMTMAFLKARWINHATLQGLLQGSTTIGKLQAPSVIINYRKAAKH